MKSFVFFILFFFTFGACEKKLTNSSLSDPIVIATGIPLGEIGPYVYSGLAANLSDLVYESLFYYQPDGEIVYDLAERLQWSLGKTRLKVFLKRPLAADVVSSVEAITKIAADDKRKHTLGPFLQGLENFERVKALTPNVIEFELRRFDRTFLYVLPVIRVVSSKETDGSTGPFRLAKQTEKEIILERKVPSPTKVNQIIARQIDSPRRALRELVAGHVDVVALINQEDFAVLKNLKEFGLGLMNIDVLYLLLENQAIYKSTYWKGVNQWFPRKEFVDLHSFQVLEPTLDSVPEIQKRRYGINEKGPLTGPTPDFKQYAKKRELSFRTTNTMDVLLAKYIQRILDGWGLPILLKPLSPPEYEKEVYLDRSFDLTLMMIKMPRALMIHYTYFHSEGIGEGQNYAGYSNPLLDKLLDKARYALDDQEAKENFALAMKYFWEDPPGIFLYWLQIPLLYRKNCSGFDLSSYLFFLSLENVRCEPSAEN